jgi:3-amino-4-hydroxybenzoic acid synthase
MHSSGHRKGASVRSTWLDISDLGDAKTSIVHEAIRRRVYAVVADSADDIAALPPSVQRVLRIRSAGDAAENADAADVMLVDPRDINVAELRTEHPEMPFAVCFEVVDHDTLVRACETVRAGDRAVLFGPDPTKIPAPIARAAAQSTHGRVITVANDSAEAAMALRTPGPGPDGVLLTPSGPGDVAELKRVAQNDEESIKLAELTVTEVTQVGTGDQACVDTCSYLRENEGILVGSHASGMVLCASDARPEPHSPSRPFRVNAGALMSCTPVGRGRTAYLSELKAGSELLAVGTDGSTRRVAVGRVKIEPRPMVSVEAVSADGVRVNLILQHDWRMRMRGPGDSVLNSAEIKPGDRILGHLPRQNRQTNQRDDRFRVEA